MRRAFCVALVVVAAFAAACTGAARAGNGPPPGGPPGLDHVLGIVPPFLQAASGVSGFGRLRYHNGPVMHTNRSYSIYWIPSGYSVAVGYTQTIDQFLGDVAVDSGKTSNVYYSDTQYYDGGGHVAYSSTFGG